MKKTATSFALLFLSLFAVFFVPYVAHAAVVGTQLLNNSRYPMPTGVQTFNYRSDVGNLNPGQTINGIQLWFNDPSFTEYGQVCLEVYPSEISFKTGSYPSNVIQQICGASATSLGNGQYNITLTTSTTTVSSFYYVILYEVIGPSFGYPAQPDILGSNLAVGHTIESLEDAPSFGPGNSFYYQVYGGDPQQFFTPDPNFSGFATSSVASLCDSAQATTTGTWIDAIGASIGNGLCRVTSFLFVPSSNSLQQFQGLKSSIESKIPFSYYFDFYDVLNGQNASSSVNFQNYAINLSNTGVGSTSKMNILQQVGNVTVLSTSTINAYLPPGLYDTLFLLMRSAIWVAVLFHLYRRIVPKHATHA